jgi:hypothetical protein
MQLAITDTALHASTPGFDAGLNTELNQSILKSDTAELLWHHYRAAWCGQGIDLKELLLRAKSLLNLQNTDAALQMLVSALRRDLGEGDKQ